MISGSSFKLQFTEGEYVFPPGVRIPELRREEVASLLSEPAKSGCKTAMKLVAAGATAVAVSVLWFHDPIFVWGSGFVAACFAGILANEILKYRCALAMASKPETVVWAHPTGFSKAPHDSACEPIWATFHSAGGRALEVGMPPETMAAVFAWLKRYNPAIRLTGALPH